MSKSRSLGKIFDILKSDDSYSDAVTIIGKTTFENSCKYLRVINSRIKSNSHFELLFWYDAAILPLGS